MNRFIGLLWLILAASSTQVLAQSTTWLQSPEHPPAQVRLSFTGEVMDDGVTLPALLEVKLKDDWKTYWRSPGEGGIAPAITWDQQVTDVHWFWPAPQQYSILGLQTFGYQEYVAFPLLVTLKQFDTVQTITASLRLSSCTNICVLTDYELSLDIDPDSFLVNSNLMHLYNKASVQVPVLVKSDNTQSVTWDKEQGLISFKIDESKAWVKPRLIIDGDPDTGFELISQQTNENGLQALFEVSHWLDDPQLDAKELSLTVIDDHGVFEYSATVKQAYITNSNVGWYKVFVFALLGGLILNVMPCVLPVLGLKLSSVVLASKHDLGIIRRQFIASAAGIIVSFWLLAAFILALKFSGQSVGWGIQFQQPWFIAFMFVVTLGFTFNMLGLFEIRLPSAWQTQIAQQGDSSYFGHFLQGVFATLLATPCSAPFLGTAVAIALASTAPMLLIVFSAMGLGMALPWLLVASFPKLARLIPKPGKWMANIKFVFAGLLFGTSIWLLSLLSPFVNSGLLISLGIVASIVCVFKFVQHFGLQKIFISLCCGLIILSVLFLLAAVNPDRWSKPLATDLEWLNLQQTNIPELVGQGRTVFVDVTADWCITCKANKVGVILQDPSYSRLKQSDVVLVKADWTQASQTISEFLQSNGRYGVPFNIVYGPNAPEGVPLPVILSHETIERALQHATTD